MGAALKCLACEHENRPEEESCVACGSSLALTLCPGCEAVNSRGAASCHKCGASLVAALPARPAARPWHWSWLLVGLSVAAAVGAHHYLQPDASASASGVIQPPPVEPPAPVVSEPVPAVALEPEEKVRPVPRAAKPVRATQIEVQAVPPAVEPQASSASSTRSSSAPARITHTRALAAPAESAVPAPRHTRGECVEAVAALGLCTMQQTTREGN